MLRIIKQYFSLILFLTSLHVYSQGIVQTGTGSAVVDSVLAKKPEAFPVINIIEEIGVANDDIKEIEQKMELEQSIARIDSLLPVYTETIQERKVQATNFLGRSPNIEQVDNQIKSWNRYRDFFENFQTTINLFAERNALLRESIEYNEKTWELTYQNAEQKEVPVNLLINVKSVWDNYKEIETIVTDKNTKYLNLQSQVSSQINVIDEVIESLKSLRYSEVYQILYLRNQPLWKTSFKSFRDTVEKEGDESISQNFTAIRTYTRAKENTIYLFIIVVALIFFGTRVLKKNLLKDQSGKVDANLQRAKDIILKDTFLVIFFLVLLSANYIFINTPKLWFDSILFLVLIGAALLVRPYMTGRFRYVPYLVIAIFILNVAKTYLWLTPVQNRVYLLIQTFVFVGILAYITYPYKVTSKLNLSRFGSLLIRLTPVFYLILVIAFISNVLGYTNLTEVCIKIINQGSELTIIFYAILIIAYGLALGFISNHYRRKIDLSALSRTGLELKVMRAIRIVIMACWLYYFLNLVDLYQPLVSTFDNILSIPYKVGSVTFTLGMIFGFIGILAASFLITGIISFLLDGQEIKLNFITLPKGVPAAISLVIRYFILALGFVLAISALGIDLSKFNLLAGALGLGIGFGLQNVVSNFISGIILVFERPILTGDVVEVNSLLGIVSKIGVRSSRISTYDGSEVVVPNNNLISNDLINWTLSNNIRRNEIWIGASYGSDPNQVLEVLLDVVSENKMVLKNPAPMALFDKFGESALSFRLLFWVYFKNSLKSKSDVSIAIYNRFEELGIEIPLPQRVVRLSKSDQNPDTLSNDFISGDSPPKKPE
ncbi:MAG: mechanosensitive ion channel [Maribacter sp.]|nr:mechanosensitive ion channel [Maribacter sp.]